MITKEIARVFRWQLVLTGFSVVLCSAVMESPVLGGVSALVGGGIALSSSLVYAVLAYSSKRVSAQEILKRHFRAEGAKFLVTVVLFVAVLTFFNAVSGLALMAGFILAQAAYWIGLLFK